MSFTDEIAKLTDTIERSFDGFTRTVEHFNRSSFRDITRNLAKFGDVVGNLNDAFDRADNLQKKALATGTSLGKFTEANNKEIKKLRGSFFDNAQELLENYSEGLRENSDGLNTLQNRMRLTGQSTDSTRQAMSLLSIATDGSTEAMDALSKQNIDLAKEYKVTNESLIQAINGLRSTIKNETLFGSSQKVAELIQKASAVGGPKAAESFKAVLTSLLGAEGTQLRNFAGIQNIEQIIRDQNISINDTFAQLLKATNTVVSISEQQARNVKGSVNESKALKTILEGAFGGGGLDLASEFKIFNTIIKKQLELQSGQKKLDEEQFVTAEMLAQEERRFYEMTLNSVYPKLITTLDGLQGVGLALSLALPFAKNIVSLAKVATVGGAAFAAINYFFPEILDYFKTSSKDADKATVESEKHLKEIKDALEKPKSGESSEKSVIDFIGNEITRILHSERNAKLNRPKDDEMARTLNELTKAISVMNSRSTPTLRND